MRPGFWFVWVLALAGCGGVPSRPAPVVVPGGGGGPTPGLALPPAVVQAPAAAGPASGGAVRVLVAQADDLARAGAWDRVAGLLERALHLAPRNPRLWSRLAAVRLAQGRYDQAEQLARRSLGLIRGDRALARYDWRLIAAAREGRGDRRGARRARRRAAIWR